MIQPKKKILLIDAKDEYIEVENRYPHLGFGYLVAQIRKVFGREYFDISVSPGSSQAEFVKYQPDIVCISAVSSNYDIAKRIARDAKSSGAFVIIGGPHISNLPQSLTKDMDIAVLFEGEKTLINILQFLESGEKIMPDKLQKIQGLAFPDGNNIIITKEQTLIENLDEIPFPARDLLKIRRHTSMFTSRGCPFRCNFCASSPYWKKVRTFSPDYIAEEIEHLYRSFNVNLIGFYDDLFSYNKARISKISESLRRRKLLGKIKFTCHCRVGSVDRELAELLAELGVVSASFGIESGNDRIIKQHKGLNVSVEKAHQSINLLKDKKIFVNSSFIIGAVGETIKDINDTYQFIKNSKLDLFEIYLLEPWPGSDLWDYAVSKKIIHNDMNWSSISTNFALNYKEAIVVSDILNKRQLWKHFKRFQRLKRLMAIKNLYKHPFAIDIPSMFVALFKQYIFRTINRLLVRRDI